MTDKMIAPSAKDASDVRVAAPPSHTPGPWVASLCKNGIEWEVKASGYFVCAFDSPGPNDESAEANARLIAAAPTMKAALFSAHAFIMAKYDGDPKAVELGLEIRAAIAKATDEPETRTSSDEGAST